MVAAEPPSSTIMLKDKLFLITSPENDSSATSTWKVYVLAGTIEFGASNENSVAVVASTW